MDNLQQNGRDETLLRGTRPLRVRVEVGITCRPVARIRRAGMPVLEASARLIKGKEFVTMK